MMSLESVFQSAEEMQQQALQRFIGIGSYH